MDPTEERPVAGGQQSSGPQDHATVDELLRADTGRGDGRPGEAAGRVPEQAGVVLHPPHAGEVALDGVPELQEEATVLPGRRADRPGEVGQAQHQGGQSRWRSTATWTSGGGSGA